MEDVVIFPSIMYESDIPYINEEDLKTLSTCCNDFMLDLVVEYLNNSNGDPSCKEKIQNAFGGKLARVQLYREDNLKSAVDFLTKVNYMTFNADSMNLEFAKQCKQVIKEVLSNPELEPYVAPVDSKVIDALLDDKFAVLDKGDPEYAFWSRVKKQKSYFKQRNGETAKGTILKPILANRYVNYKLIDKGLDFIIDKLSNNINPVAWRLL